MMRIEGWLEKLLKSQVGGMSLKSCWKQFLFFTVIIALNSIKESLEHDEKKELRCERWCGKGVSSTFFQVGLEMNELSRMLKME